MAYDVGRPRASVRIAAGLVARILLFGAASLILAACASQVSREELAGEYFNLGNAYFGLEDFEKAAEYYARAADLDPELRAASLNLARAYISEARYTEALDLLDELLSDDRFNTRVLQTRAYALYRAGRPNEALGVYRSALSEDPFNPDLLYNVAIILRGQGEVEEALSRVRVAIRVADGDSELELLAGELAYELDRFEDAIGYLESYVAQEREDSSSRSLLADSLRKAGFYSRALTVYDEVLREEERNADALFGKSVALLVGAEDVDAGLEALRSAVSAGFTDAERAEAELLVEENVALEEVRRILVDRGVLTEEGADDAPDAEPAPSDADVD